MWKRIKLPPVVAEFCFTIPVKPVAKDRARARAFLKWVGKSPKAIANVTESPKNANYYPAVTESFIKAFSQLPRSDKFFQLLEDKPWDGMVRFDTMFYFPHTKESKRKSLVFCCVKPDKDNCEKNPMDALEGMVWSNDSRIITGTPVKLYDDGDGPRTECRIRLYERC